MNNRKRVGDRTEGEFPIFPLYWKLNPGFLGCKPSMLPLHYVAC